MGCISNLSPSVAHILRILLMFTSLVLPPSAPGLRSANIRTTSLVRLSRLGRLWLIRAVEVDDGGLDSVEDEVLSEKLP